MPESATIPESRKLPDAQALAAQYACTVDELPQVFADRLVEIAPATHTLSDLMQEEIYDGLEALHSLWAAARNTPALSDLASHTATAQEVYPGTNIRSQENRLRQLETAVLDPPSLITLPTSPVSLSLAQERGAYNMQGEWHKIIPPDTPDSVFLVRPQILIEAAELEDTLTRPEADLFHPTSSAALDGIGRHRALLSAQRLHDIGEVIVSGEELKDQYDPLEEPTQAVMMTNLFSGMWATKQWFDEFPVIFGFQSSQMENYAAAFRRSGSPHPDFHGYNANGHHVGPTVPLEPVTVAYTPARHLPELRAWADTHSPHTATISLEAGRIMRNFSRNGQRIYPDYLYRDDTVTPYSARELAHTALLTTCRRT